LDAPADWKFHDKYKPDKKMTGCLNIGHADPLLLSDLLTQHPCSSTHRMPQIRSSTLWNSIFQNYPRLRLGLFVCYSHVLHCFRTT
jgi:hypothetical protein